MRFLKPFDAAFFLVLLGCMTSRKPIQENMRASAFSIVGGEVGFCKPVVKESSIFYSNRYTDQDYHSVDCKRTEEAFFRDLKVVMSDKKLRWKPLRDDCSDSIHLFLAKACASIDSLPLNVINILAHDSLNFVCVFYNVRFTHTQLVGTNSADAGQSGSLGSNISRKISYICSIVDVKKNKTIFSKQIFLEETGIHLDFIEKSIRMLFHEMLSDR